MGKKWWQSKPYRNWPGVVPKPMLTGRRIRSELLPRVQQQVRGGVISKPLWLDACLAHPPPLDHKFAGEKPTRFQWREEDRLRRTWQQRNPEASMHPKVLFLDESQLPPDTKAEHPADAFVRRQTAFMRRGLSEDEAYRRAHQQLSQEQRGAKDEVAAARAQAIALGATPAVGVGSAGSDAAGGAGGPAKPGFATRLLRRFAEEARDGDQPYPRHWFNEDGTWRGIGDPSQFDRKTVRAIERTAATQKADGDVGGLASLFSDVQLRNEKDAIADAAAAEAEAAAAEKAEEYDPDASATAGGRKGGD
jgi:hypothetical protein